MEIKKAKTVSDVEKKTIERKIKEQENAIKMMEEELALREESLAIQLKYPQVIKPNYEFETQQEYDEIKKKEWDFNFRKNKMAIQAQIEIAEQQIEQMKGE